jgi:nicotinamide mononucleotide transporter
MISDWLANNYIELFGAVTGVIYVIFEIRQIIWLWPLGIITSGVYILVFFSSKFYADMSLQVYYLVISVLGWYWWIKGARRKAQGSGQRDQSEGHRAQVEREGEEVTNRTEIDRKGEEEKGGLKVTRLRKKTGLILLLSFCILYIILWYLLSHFTDSPVPEWDSFLTSLSIIATWMLARKIIEHWYLWIVVNSVSSFVFYIKGLYPTVGLYIIYLLMSFAGLREWQRSLRS